MHTLFGEIPICNQFLGARDPNNKYCRNKTIFAFTFLKREVATTPILKDFDSNQTVVIVWQSESEILPLNWAWEPTDRQRQLSSKTTLLGEYELGPLAYDCIPKPNRSRDRW